MQQTNAFDFVGSADVFDSRLTVLLTELKAVANGWQEFFSAEIVSFIIRQSTDRHDTKTLVLGSSVVGV